MYRVAWWREGTSRLEVCREIPLETSSDISRREIYVTRYRTNKIPVHFVWAHARARARACVCVCVHVRVRVCVCVRV